MSGKKKLGYGLLAAAFLYLFFHLHLLNLNPFTAVKADTPSMAVSGQDGCLFVIDQSGKRFYKVDQKERIVFLQNGKRKSGNHFYEIKDLTTDKDGNIYILDIRRRDTGRRVESERILKYSPKGKFQSVIYQVDYGEKTVLKNNIYKLDFISDTLAWFQFTPDGYEICRENGEKKEYNYPDASNMLVDFSLNPVTGCHGYLTKLGEIYEETEKGELVKVYSIEGKEGYFIPWDLAYDKNGVLYYADIGQRAIFQVGKDGKAQKVLQNNSMEIREDTTLEWIKSCPIYYNLNLGEALATTDTYGIVTIKDERLSYSDQYKLSFLLWLQCAAAWIIAFLGLACGVFFIVRLADYLTKVKSMSIKMVTGLLAGTLVMTILFTLVIMKDWNTRMTDEMIRRVSSVSSLVAELVPADKVDAIDSVEDYMNRDYQEVRSRLRNLFIGENGYAQDLYCVIYRIQNGMVTLSYSIEDYVGAVYPYDWPYEGADEETIMEEQVQKSYIGLSTTEGSFLFVLSPIVNDEGKSVGIMEVGTDLYAFQQDNRNMVFQVIISALVMAVTIILIIFEVLEFIQGRNAFVKNRSSASLVSRAFIPVEMTRIYVFIIFFITNMTRGFLPIYLMKLAKTEETFGISPEILISLALSCEVLFGALTSFGGNVIIRFLGRRKTAVMGSLLFAAGLSLRAAVPTILSFIAGNAIMGAGWGVLLLIVQVMIAEREEEEKTKGFTGYTAASLSGVNCGVVFGAFLINWLSYRAILGIIGVLSLGTVVFSVLYIWDEKGVDIKPQRKEKEGKGLSAMGFLLSPRVFLYFAAIVVPVVAGGYFLSYLYPILAEGFGVSETDIGYSYLLNGLCIICLGNALTNYLVKRFFKKLTLAFSLVFYAGAFIAYGLFPGLGTLLAALVLLGLSDSFGLPVQGTYYTDLEEVEKYGLDKAMGIYSLFENMAQVAGSFIFAFILMKGVEKGLIAAGAALGVLAVVFMVFGQGKRKSED